MSEYIDKIVQPIFEMISFLVTAEPLLWFTPLFQNIHAFAMTRFRLMKPDSWKTDYEQLLNFCERLHFLDSSAYRLFRGGETRCQFNFIAPHQHTLERNQPPLEMKEGVRSYEVTTWLQANVMIGSEKEIMNQTVDDWPSRVMDTETPPT